MACEIYKDITSPLDGLLYKSPALIQQTENKQSTKHAGVLAFEFPQSQSNQYRVVQRQQLLGM